MKKSIPELKKFRTPEGLWSGWFYDECWRANVHIVWNVDKEQKLQRFMKRVFGIKYVRSFNCSARCMEVRNGKDHQIAHVIAFRKWEFTPYGMDNLSHEALHATHNLLHERNMKMTDETDEAYAYLLASIVRRSLVILNQ